MFDAKAYHCERLANLEATTGPDAEPWATDRRLREYAHQRARSREARASNEGAACHARIIGSLDAPEPERARSSFTPRVREQIFARDGYRCQIPGCRWARNLEAHHIDEQCMGGAGTVSNGTTLCGGHHAARHEGLLEITGVAPAIKVKWLVPGTTPVEDEERRRVLVEREIDQILHRTQPVPRGTPKAGLNDSGAGPVVERNDDVPRGT